MNGHKNETWVKWLKVLTGQKQHKEVIKHENLRKDVFLGRSLKRDPNLESLTLLAEMIRTDT